MFRDIRKVLLFKACVRYFLSKKVFFHQMIAHQKLKNVFSSKKLFSFSRDSSFCNFFLPFLIFRFKNGNGSRIIYDVMNWLALAGVTFLMVFNNPLSEYLFLKNFLHAIAVLGCLPK